jgi:hypothetical protein
MLYSCKNDINSYEIGKMVPYFWKKFYVILIINSIILNILLSILILAFSHSYLDAVLFFISLLIFCLIYFKAKLSNIVTRAMSLYIKQRKIDTKIEIEFYDSYLIQKKGNYTLKLNYDSFNKCIENDTNFYLQYLEKSKKKIIIIQKNNCNLELVNFIRITFKNLENHLGGEITFTENEKFRKSKFVKITKLLLIIVPILSIFGGLYTFAMYNKINNIYDANFTQSAWLFWLWLPVPIISIIISYIYQKRGVNCSKNILVGFIISILLLIFGSFSLIPYSYDFSGNYDIIEDYQSVMNVRIPASGQLKSGTSKSFNHKNISNLKIIIVNYKKEDTSILTNDILNNENWILSTLLTSKLENLIPSVFSTSDNIYYLFYNKTLDEYNTIPNNEGTYQFYTIRYDISEKNLLIYTFDYNYQ